LDTLKVEIFLSSRFLDTLKGFSQFKNDVDRLTRTIVSRSPAPAPNATAVWDVIYWKLHNAVARDPRGN
jgi:hypothetical protein